MRHSINSTHTIKAANSAVVLDIIRKSNSVTIEDIVTAAHLSRPTVLGIIEEQVKSGIIERIGFAETSIGRQPTLYSLTTSNYFSIGIDFEFPPFRLTLVDLTGAVRYQNNWVCSFAMDRDTIIQLLVENIQAAMDALNITCDNIIGIGLGIPGTVNKTTNMSGIISRIPKWNNAPLNDILSSHFPVPIFVRNDAHLISMVAQSNLGFENQDFLYIAYRTGIGMAVIRDGKLSEDCFGNSGYIGHTTVDVNGDLCVCGHRGCLETFSSKSSIEHKYAQAKVLDTLVPFDDILQLATQGDNIAVNILETAGMYFGIAIANAIKLLDVYTIVIGDLDCSSDHVFVQSIESTINHYCNNYALSPIKLITQSSKTNDYALGAALFALGTFFHKPKLKISVR